MKLLLLVSICACSGSGVPLPPPSDPAGAVIEAPIMLGVMAGHAAEHKHDHAQQWIGRNVRIDGVHVRWQACETVDDCAETVDEAPFTDLVGIETLESDAGAELKLLRFKLGSSTEKRLEFRARDAFDRH